MLICVPDPAKWSRCRPPGRRGGFVFVRARGCSYELYGDRPSRITTMPGWTHLWFSSNRQTLLVPRVVLFDLRCFASSRRGRWVGCLICLGLFTVQYVLVVVCFMRDIKRASNHAFLAQVRGDHWCLHTYHKWDRYFGFPLDVYWRCLLGVIRIVMKMFKASCSIRFYTDRRIYYSNAFVCL